MRPFSRFFLWFSLVALTTAVMGMRTIGEPDPAHSSAPSLHLHAGEYAPAQGLDRDQAIRAASKFALESSDVELSYLVQFSGPIQPQWHAALTDVAKVQSYIPDFAFKTSVNTRDIPRLWSLPGVVWAGPWQPEFRLSPDLAGSQVALIWLADSSPALSLTGTGLNFQAHGPGYIVARGSLSQFRRLAHDPSVTWIQPLYAPKLTNDVATGLMHAPIAWSSGLQGQGQLITVADTGIDTGIDYPHIIGDMHPDLDNRVAHIKSWPISPAWYGALYNPTDDDGAADVDFGHGTHVAGSIAGNGARSLGQYAGVAPRAQLAFQALEQYCEWTPAYAAADYQPYTLVGIPQDVSELYQEAYNWGSRIHTNSWNLGETNLYTSEAAQTDAFVWDHQDMCVIFSVGNEARDADGDGLVDLGSIAAPATAKNIIAVGGCESLRLDRDPSYGDWLRDAQDIWFPANPIRDDPMADAGTSGLFAASGRGPTYDGRIAPHIVAPGSWIISILSSQASTNFGSWGAVFPFGDDYHYLGGTSMSAPLAAGAVALVREAYMRQGHTPSAALLKATMIQSASEVAGQYAAPFNQSGPVPNMHEGWGALNVASATSMTRQWIDDGRTLTTGQSSAHTFAISASSQPVKVTLVWTDAPADPQASRSLVNDLDLRVTAPDGLTYQGNVMVSGWSASGGMADRVNNVECVYLHLAQEGQYTATVLAYNVPIPGQRFALLIDAPEPQSPRVHLPIAFGQPAPTATPTASTTLTTVTTAQPTLPVATTATLSPTPSIEPSATPTPTPSPTPSPAPREWREDFAVIDSELWTVATADTYRMGYTDAAYQIQIAPARGQAGSLPARYQDGDYALSVTARAATDAAQGMGLILSCEEDAEHNIIAYLAFVVTTDGRYGIVRRDGSYLVGLTQSPVISTGQGTNRVAVSREGDRIACEVNGTRLITMNSVEVARGTRFGLISKALGEGWTDARFDDFWLRPLGDSPSSHSHQIRTRPLRD